MLLTPFRIILITTLVRRRTKSKVFILSLNSLILAVLIISALAYTTTIGGGDPLALLVIYIISDPALLVLGIVLLFCGKRFQVSIFNRLIPFVGIVALTFTIFVPTFDGSDYRIIGLAVT